MATNYYNAQIGVVDASGNVNVIYPITKAANVDLVATSYSTVEACLAALGTAAFKNASDTYTATGSTVATTKAVYDAYSTLNSNKQAKGSYASSSHSHNSWSPVNTFDYTSSNASLGNLSSATLTYITNYDLNLLFAKMTTSKVTSTTNTNVYITLSRKLLYLNTTGPCAVWLLNDDENPYNYANAKYYTQVYGHNSGTSDNLCFYFRKTNTGNWDSGQSFQCTFMAITR